MTTYCDALEEYFISMNYYVQRTNFPERSELCVDCSFYHNDVYYVLSFHMHIVFVYSSDKTPGLEIFQYYDPNLGECIDQFKRPKLNLISKFVVSMINNYNKKHPMTIHRLTYFYNRNSLKIKLLVRMRKIFRYVFRLFLRSNLY